MNSCKRATACNQGRIKGPYHSTCRVFKCLLSTVGCRIIEEFVCFNLIFAYSSSKQTDLSSTQDNLPQNPKFLTEIQLASR